MKVSIQTVESRQQALRTRIKSRNCQATRSIPTLNKFKLTNFTFTFHCFFKCSFCRIRGESWAFKSLDCDAGFSGSGWERPTPRPVGNWCHFWWFRGFWTLWPATLLRHSARFSDEFSIWQRCAIFSMKSAVHLLKNCWNMQSCCHAAVEVKACEVPLVAWCLPAAELQQVLKLHPAAANIMDEFVDQQEKRVIWPRASKINLLSHTGPNFTKQLLKKVVVKHFRASSTVWSPYNTTTSMRVVITGKVLVQKNTRADFELKSCLSISPQKERRKTVHIGEPDQVEVEDRTLAWKNWVGMPAF